MDIGAFVVSTSFVPAFLCFVAAWVNLRMYRFYYFRHTHYFKAAAWTLFGACYVLTQFGGEWFLANQRAWFRLTGILVMAAEIFPAFTKFIEAIIVDARRLNER